MFDEAAISQMFVSYAYSPEWVYFIVIGFMTMSSLGLPVPEEFVLISAGFICYMVLNPDIYPPPYEGAVGVNYITLSIVCLIAVILSDVLIFMIGKYLGPKLKKHRFFKKMLSDEKMAKVDSWYSKYGAWVCGIFRFLPGIRFPGHMSCGMMGVSIWKFIAVDGFAALISVPTQVILVAFYGKVILDKLKQFKLIVLAILAILLIIYLIRKFIISRKNREVL